MDNITEGLHAGDLEDLVLPMVSIDEFESRVSDEAVVVGFYVHEHGAAEDINRFIQRTPVSILDSEISPAPDQHGYFMVFVELLNNTNFSKNVETLLQEISPLVKISKWRMQIRGQDKLLDFDKNTLKKIISPKNNDLQENVYNFLQDSSLTNVSIDDNIIVLEGLMSSFQFVIEKFDSMDAVDKKYNLAETAISYSNSDLVRCKKIAANLGLDWSVNHMAGFDIITRENEENTLVLKPLCY